MYTRKSNWITKYNFTKHNVLLKVWYHSEKENKGMVANDNKR